MSGDLALAVAYLDAGRADRALEVVAPLVAGAPGDPEVVRVAARASLGTGDAVAALELVRPALARRPQDLELHLLVVDACSALRRHRDAARAAAAAVAMHPVRWEAHAAAAVADVRSGRVRRRAVTAAREAVRLAPEQPQAHVIAGWADLVRHRHRAAQRRFETALAIDPLHRGAQDGLAHLRLSRFDPGSAAVQAMDRLATSPSDRSAEALLRAAGHRATHLLCLGPLIVAQASARITDAAFPPSYGFAVQRGPEWTRPVAVSQPVLVLLLLLLVPAAVLWAVRMRRTTQGRLGRLLRIVPSTQPGLAVWAAGSALAVVVCIVAATRPRETAQPAYLLASGLSFVPGLVCLLLEQRRNRRRSR